MSERHEYVALICGGRGENTWDTEVTFSAPNLISAAAMAHAHAENMETGDIVQPVVVSVEEVDK